MVYAAMPGHKLPKACGRKLGRERPRPDHHSGCRIVEATLIFVHKPGSREEAKPNVFRKSGMVRGGEGYARIQESHARCKTHGTFGGYVNMVWCKLPMLAFEILRPGECKAQLGIGRAGKGWVAGGIFDK